VNTARNRELARATISLVLMAAVIWLYEFYR
jgi:hypothetical protein